MGTWHSRKLLHYGSLIIRFFVSYPGNTVWSSCPSVDIQSVYSAAKSSSYIYIRYICFGLIWFYGISTIVGYLMLNPLYIYTLNIHDSVWFGFMVYQPLYVIHCQILFTLIYKIYRIWFGLGLWHIIHCWLFNAKSSFFIYIKYIWFGLVGFTGKSSHVGYLRTNPDYTYIYIYIEREREFNDV